MKIYTFPVITNDLLIDNTISNTTVNEDLLNKIKSKNQKQIKFNINGIVLKR